MAPSSLTRANYKLNSRTVLMRRKIQSIKHLEPDYTACELTYALARRAKNIKSKYSVLWKLLRKVGGLVGKARHQADGHCLLFISLARVARRN